MTEELQTLEELETRIQTLLKAGQTFHAYNSALKALELFPNNYRLREYGALALLRTGAVHEAKTIIQPILEELFKQNTFIPEKAQAFDQDILSMIAFIFKESWRHGMDIEDLQNSRAMYQFLFEKYKKPVFGSNAAILCWLLGEDENVEHLANQVIKLNEDPTIKKDTLEVQVAFAEAYLILQQFDLAQSTYTRLQQKYGNSDYSGIVSALQQIKLLLEGGFIVPKSIIDCLKPPTIVAFTGQMIDHSDDNEKRFIPEMESAVYMKIAEKLSSIDAKIGYSSASCGSDLLFIEAMLARGGEVNIILPFEKEDFIIHNVKYAGPRWIQRFEKALEQGHSLTYATEEKYLGHDMLYRFSNQVLHGLAEMRGQFLLSPPHLIAVWDSKPDSLIGGASDFIDHWADIRTLHLIDLDEIKTEVMENQPHHVPIHLKTIKKSHKQIIPSHVLKTPRIIKTMLFADLAGFSKLKEEHIPGFISFLEELKSTMAQLPTKPESINTWGDALFVVMNDALSLAEFALLLTEMVRDISHNTRGLPPLNIRTSLHAGPVYEALDPFRQQKNYWGGHINRAARLEPVTVIGEVYATQQFMALLTAEQSAKRVEKSQQNLPFVERFTCEYVGVVALAKGFGEQPVYHLRWY